MEKQEYKREVFVIIGIIIVSMLFILTCKKFDPFQNSSKKGYPVPQGNLPNYNYGTKENAKKDQYEEWKKVFARGGNAVEYYGAFRPPAPRTMLR